MRKWGTAPTEKRCAAQPWVALPPGTACHVSRPGPASQPREWRRWLANTRAPPAALGVEARGPARVPNAHAHAAPHAPIAAAPAAVAASGPAAGAPAAPLPAAAAAAVAAAGSRHSHVHLEQQKCKQGMDSLSHSRAMSCQPCAKRHAAKAAGTAAGSRTRLAPNSVPYVGGRPGRKRPPTRRCSSALLPAGAGAQASHAGAEQRRASPSIARSSGAGAGCTGNPFRRSPQELQPRRTSFTSNIDMGTLLAVPMRQPGRCRQPAASESWRQRRWQWRRRRWARCSAQRLRCQPAPSLTAGPARHEPAISGRGVAAACRRHAAGSKRPRDSERTIASRRSVGEGLRPSMCAPSLHAQAPHRHK